MKKLAAILLIFALFLGACSDDASGTKDKEPTNEPKEETNQDTNEDTAQNVGEEENKEEDAAFKEEYMAYSQKLNAIVGLEAEALNLYNQLLESDMDDFTFSDSIYYDILPIYDEYLIELQKIMVEDKELREVHEKLVEATTIQRDAFAMMVQGLDEQDQEIFNQALEKMNTYTQLSRDAIYLLNDVATSHGVPYDLEKAAEAMY